MTGSSSQAQSRAERRRRSSGVVVPNKPRWYQRAAAWLIFATIRLVAMTLRYRWTDESGNSAGKPAQPALYCTWHNRLALCMIGYHDHAKIQNPTAGLAALVSASKDGGFLAAILECFNVHPVRGSTSRRGPQALLELTTWAERGYDLAITPDGPRGPRYIVQDGAMSLAQVTGFRVIPFTYYLHWKLCVNSWDRFQIPLPFSRCEMHFGKPIHVPREASDEQRELLRQQLQASLLELSKD